MVEGSSAYMISCDWGTSSLRLYLVDRVSYKVIHAISSTEGVKTVNKVNQSLGKESSTVFKNVLTGQIEKLSAKSNLDLAGVPLMASGMVTSSIGWIELPYASLPFPLSGKAAVSRFIPSEKDFPHDTVLISGVQSTAPDIMRGEECQMIGLLDQIDTIDGWYVFPGTHSKHLLLKNREITDFKTFMTGELFGLMADQSILQNTLKSSSTFDEAAFLKGVEQGVTDNLLNSFFKIRAESVHHKEKRSRDLLSGMLIGYELSALRSLKEAVTLCASSAFKERYEAALNYLRPNSEDRILDLQLMDQAIPLGHLQLLKHLKT